jgi:hypothetical protein
MLHRLLIIRRAHAEIGKGTLNKWYFSESAIDAFLEHPAVQAWLDKHNINPGEIAPEQREGGIYYGKLPEFGELWSIEKTYEDFQTGNQTKMIPDDYILAISDELEATLEYGMITDMSQKPPVTVTEPYYSKVVTDPNNDEEQTLRTTARPLPLLRTPDECVLVKVL